MDVTCAKLSLITPFQTILICLKKMQWMDGWMQAPGVAFRLVLLDDRQIWEVWCEAGQGCSPSPEDTMVHSWGTCFPVCPNLEALSEVVYSGTIPIICVFVCFEVVSLCGPGYPEPHYEDQASLCLPWPSAIHINFKSLQVKRTTHSSKL